MRNNIPPNYKNISVLEFRDAPPDRLAKSYLIQTLFIIVPEYSLLRFLLNYGAYFLKEPCLRQMAQFGFH